MLSFARPLLRHPGYTKGVAEVTGSVKLFHCDGVHDLSMFAGLTRLGGSVEVSVRGRHSARHSMTPSIVWCLSLQLIGNVKIAAGRCVCIWLSLLARKLNFSERYDVICTGLP